MRINQTQIEALAGFRNALRRFLAFSEEATKAAGVTAQQYQALLAIKAWPRNNMTVGDLAEEMLLKAHGAGQLVDRLVALGMVQRTRSEADKRSVCVSLIEKGEATFQPLVTQHFLQLSRRKKQLADVVRQLRKIPQERAEKR